MNILIDQAWLDENRKDWGGYLLDQEGATYTLEVDVATPRTAFAVGAENITLDIKDRTISFANLTMQRVWNYAFSSKRQRRGRGWVLPSGAYIQGDCDYFKRECQVGKHALVFPPIEPSGDYTLRHKANRTLNSGEHYALTFWDDRENAIVECTIGGLKPAVGPKRDKPGTTNYAIFTPQEDVTGPIEFKVRTKNADYEGAFRIDNVKLNYSRCHGITGRGSAVHWNNPAPDLPVTTEYERSLKSFTLKGDKGRIVEGRYGFGGSCINLRSSKNCRIEGNVYLSLHPRSINDSIGSCIQAMYAENLHIDPRVRTNNRATSICNRQSYNGYSIFAQAIKGDNFFGLNSIGSNQGAVACSLKKDNNGSLIISGKGATQVRFTNGFFVMVKEGGPLSKTIVQDLDIKNTGVNDGGRGIHWDGHPDASGYNSINNCHIVTKELPLHQEYTTRENYPLGGCYGIQVEGCCNNLIIENNYVEINGDSESAVYRLSGTKDYSKPMKPTTINNTFVSLCDDPPTQKRRACIFKPYRVDGDTLGSHSGNKIIFNDCLVELERGNIGNILFENTEIEYVDQGSKHDSAYDLSWKGGGTVEFRNTTFVGSGTFEKLTKNVDLNLLHAGSDVIIKFTDEVGSPIYTLHGDAETKQTSHIWGSGIIPKII